MERKTRQEIPVEQTWKVEDLFPSEEAFEEALKKMDEAIGDIVAYEGRLTESGQTLYEGIVAYEQMIVDIYRLANYAHLGQAVDASDTSSQEKYMRFGSLASRFEAATTFVTEEIMEMGNDQFEAIFEEEDKLENYRRFLEDLFEEKQHKLTKETEQVLASLSEVHGAPYRTYSVSKLADMVFDSFEDKDGKELHNSFALYEGTYAFHEDPEIRKKAYESFNKTLKQYNNTYAAIYNTQVKQEVIMAKLRGYENVTEMLLRSQHVTEEMYERQLNVIYKELAPHMRRYADLLKEQLGLETLHYYDLKAPMDNTYNPSATYEEAKEVIMEALQIMGPEYMAIMEEAFDNRWIDYADNIGKSTGAFCASPYGCHSYILVTFQNNMRDAFTLIHELGHAGHFTLANREQLYLNTRPSRYTIEAPSTMNEMILGRHLLQKYDDPQMKKWVILQFLGTYYHNFVTHLLEGEFQRRVYDLAESGQPLTSALLNRTKLEVLKGFWGQAVEIDDDAGMTWMRQPHYYMGLYPYTYSAGLTASTAVSEKIFEEGQPAVDAWIDMLKEGGRLKPLDLLKVAGMDMSTDEPVRSAVAYVGSLIDQLEDLCK